MRLGIKIISSVKKHSISEKCHNGGGGGPCLSSFSSSSSLNSLGSPKLASWGDVFFRSDRLNETLMIYMAEFTAIRAGGVVTLMGFFRMKLVFS